MLLAICANCLLPKPANLPKTYAAWGDPITTQALQTLGDLPLPHTVPLPKGHPPFELREVEHSLCEFDKYQRMAEPSTDAYSADSNPKNAKRKYNGT